MRWFFYAGIAGYALRLLLILVSDGCNDIFAWARFAHRIVIRGLEGTYQAEPLFNHPPLMGLWAAVALWASQGLGWRFSIVFKLPGLVAEVLIGCILWSAFKRRGAPAEGRRAFAAYGLSLCSILISGFHGNTDPLYWMLGLLAIYLLETRRAAFWAGLALGAAINVKLIPVLLVIPLATRLRSRAALARVAGGCLLGLAPYALVFLTFSSAGLRAFRHHVFAYQSYLEFWGIELFLRVGQGLTRRAAPGFATVLEELSRLYWHNGAWLVLLAVAGVALWQWRKRGTQLDGYQWGAVVFSMFLVFGSGFGVQYTGAVVPWLLMVSISAGLRFATSAGVFIGLVYFYFLRVFYPAASLHLPYPADFVLPAFITWMILATIWLNLMRGRLYLDRLPVIAQSKPDAAPVPTCADGNQ